MKNGRAQFRPRWDLQSMILFIKVKFMEFLGHNYHIKWSTPWPNKVDRNLWKSLTGDI